MPPSLDGANRLMVQMQSRFLIETQNSHWLDTAAQTTIPDDDARFQDTAQNNLIQT